MTEQEKLILLVRSLSAALRKAAPENTLPDQAIGYLRTAGFIPSHQRRLEDAKPRITIDECTPEEWDAASRAVRESKPPQKEEAPEAPPHELADLVRFLCKVWTDVDSWDCPGNQARLKAISGQPYDRANIEKAVKWVLSNGQQEGAANGR